MKTTHYRLKHGGCKTPFRAAVVADLHDGPYHKILPILEREKPDLILIPGDLTESLTASPMEVSRPGLALLSACASLAPTFYSLGNHEIGGCHGSIYKAKLAGEKPSPFCLSEAWRERIEGSGVTYLYQSFVRHGDMLIGGLGSGLLNPGWKPDLGWLEDFTRAEGYKLLLCHHPEYFDRYLRLMDVDLIVSGHAHGGQWRLFGRGVYAPDQHLFPKYTSGVHEDRLVISKGTYNSAPLVPRFFNPCEVVILDVEGIGDGSRA